MGVGVRAGCKLHTRARSLQLLSRSVEALSERIRTTAVPLHRLLPEVVPPPFCAQLCDGDNPRDALLQAADACAEAWALTAADRRLWREFAEGFGTADKEGEVRRCVQYAARLRTVGEEAKEAAVRCGRLYMTLGLCGGGLLALLMI